MIESAILISISVVLALAAGFFGIRAMERKRAREVLSSFSGEDLLGVCSSANCLGLESQGPSQVRGNGVLVLTEERLYFEMWVPKRVLDIRVESIEEVLRVNTHLGKYRGAPLLKVAFRREDGGHDSCAWQVNNFSTWHDGLCQLAKARKRVENQ